jgi:RNA-directed DNA polymerase
VQTCHRYFTAEKDGKSMNVRDSTTLKSEKRTDTSLFPDWKSIDWDIVRKSVNRLQTRIAKAVIEKKWYLVKRLQYLLTHSQHAKLLAVKLVTSKAGRKTAGVDGMVWLTDEIKLEAALHLTDKSFNSQPLKRVLIPKPGSTKKRPLSIPTMYDRAMQTLYAMALQPIAETTADNRSFGFRLFRCAQDAFAYVHMCLSKENSAQWILEGDIKSCFDSISHDWLMHHIPMDKNILKKFLKAGYLLNGELFPTEEGTPQGGPLSPILANMALDGLEGLLRERYPQSKVNFMRYADDFLVTAQSKELAEDIKCCIQEFLATRGLELSEEKTLITHIDDGFDFLGWSFRKYHGKLLPKPSKKSQKRIKEKIRNIFHSAAAWTQDDLIKKLNPVIRGWSQYHRHSVASKVFKDMDHEIWSMSWRWARRRHSHKGKKWTYQRYWTSNGYQSWIFCTKDNVLAKLSETKIKRHFPLKLSANPFLDREYFLNRMDEVKERIPTVQTKLTFFSCFRPEIGL